MNTVLGIDRIDEYDQLLAGKRIGLITNYSGVNSEGEVNIDLLVERGYTIQKLFTPEHGLYGATAGATVEDSVYTTYNIPIISLYGDKLKATKEDLADIDLLVYDIQDVGLRYYTYIYTLTYMIEAAAENKIPLVVLDRPNPLGGSMVLGGTMEDQYKSFVGDYGLTVRYGLTIGEVGRYFINYRKLDVSYRVIELLNYSRETYFPDTGLLWNVPSPALPTFEATICYSGGCFFEGTNISEGRGSAKPFQMYGAPFIDMDALYKEMKPLIQNEKVAFRKRSFVPTHRKFQGEICFGLEFEPLDKTFNFIPTALQLIKKIKDMYPQEFAYRMGVRENHMKSLTGSDLAEKYFDGAVSLSELLDTWRNEAETFQKASESSRLYS